MQPEINCPVIRVPEVTPCEISELQPLLLHLEANVPIEETQIFPRGTLLPDGRLDLCKQSVGPEGCALLTEALRDNLQVRSLLLGTDAIGDQGAKNVANLIESNSHLEIMYLGCNKISGTGTKEITSVLEENTNIKGLWLKRNPIGDEGLFAIAAMLRSNTHLQSLDVVNCGFTITGLSALCDTLCESNSTLKRLYLSGNGIGIEGAKAIARVICQNDALESLLLSVNSFGDEGTTIIAEALKENQSVKEISLGSVGMTADGIKALCEAFSTHPTIETLDLNRAASQIPLGAEANNFSASAEYFAQFLKNNQSLRRLLLHGTKITKAGAEIIDEAAQGHPKLVQLQFDIPLSAKLKSHLAANRENAPHIQTPEDRALIRSVYRTA